MWLLLGKHKENSDKEWILVYENHKKFEKKFHQLQKAEQEKYKRWALQVPGSGTDHGAHGAAEHEHIEIKKIRGAKDNQWELVIGTEQRVFMDIKNEVVTILDIGHLR